MIIIREFNSEKDAALTYQLFYETVHYVNAQDYSKEQLDVWAPKDKNLQDWEHSFVGNFSFVAVDTVGHKMVGFSDLRKDGYLNRGYVHKDYQRKGIGRLLLQSREQKAKEVGLKKVFSDVSITAKYLFESEV